MSLPKFIDKLNRLAMVIPIFLALAIAVKAQTNAQKPDNGNAPIQQSANVSPQTAELREAEELGSRVVKLYAEKKFDEALRLAMRVLEIREKALGPEHVLIDEVLYNLAEINIAKLKYKEAEVYYERLLVRYEKIYGSEHVKTASIVQSLGYLSFRRGEMDEADARLSRALAIFEKRLPPSSEKAASLALDLVEVYRKKRDLSKMEASYLKAIELSEHVTKPQDVDSVSIEARAWDGYECFLNETKGANEAKRVLAKLIESRKKVGEHDKLDVDNDVLNGRALELPKPSYPQMAKYERVEGTVKVRVRINEKGEVVNAWAICGPPLLRDAAVSAARKARFSATSFKGKPVKVTGLINYNFAFKW